MRLPSLGLILTLVNLGVAKSNLTTQPGPQQILQGDFTPPSVFENSNVVRTINLEKGYVRETINVVVINTDNKPQSEYYVPFGADAVGKVGGFEARDKKNAAKGVLEVSIAPQTAVLKGNIPSISTQYYVVHFPEPLKPKAQLTLSISYYILSSLTPLPALIKQEDKQYVTYSFSAYLPSAYSTLKQKTKVKFPNADIPDYTTTSGLTKSTDPEKQGSSFTYGSYDKKVAPGTTYPVSVRYEFTKPIMTCSLLERDIEVSHWGGNLATEERYWLRNDGAGLSNQFNRVTWASQTFYVQAGQMATSALRELRVALKPGSVDPYFIDDIGNVSTSHFRPHNTRDAILELKPRYPVFGGWKYSFRIGWNNNLNSFLRKLSVSGTPQTHLLSIPLIEGPKMPEGIQYENFVLRIILPEGARNIKHELSSGTGSPMLTVSQSLHKTFMDTLGRTELKLVATNVVDEARDLTVFVAYEYPALAGLRKPLSIVGACLGVFVLAWAVGRVDTSIGAKKVVVVKSL